MPVLPTQTQSHLRLPPELIDLTLSFYCTDLCTDTDTLQKCSTAFKDFGLAALADKRLWKDVEVYPDSFGERKDEKRFCITAAQLVKTSANRTVPIFSYIRTLQITISESLNDSEVQQLIPLLALPSSSSSAFTPLGYKSSPFLSSLHSLTLSSEEDPTISWSSLSDSFKRAFLDRLGFTDHGNKCIEELQIIYVEEFPLGLLEQNKHLKRLHLKGLSHISGLLPKVSSPSPGLKLDHLGLHRVSLHLHNLPGWLIGRSIIASLRSLSFHWQLPSRLDFPLLPKIFAACKATLEELDVNWGTNMWLTSYDPSDRISSEDDSEARAISNWFPISTLINLRKLTIHTSIYCISFYPLVSVGEESTSRMRYSASIWKIGQLLGDIRGGERNGELEVELKMTVSFTGPDAPSITEVRFGGLLPAFPAPPSSSLNPSPSSTINDPPILITLNVVSVLRNTEPIPFRTIQGDFHKNEVLSGLIRRGLLRVVGSD